MNAERSRPPLTPEQEQLLLENQGLVYWQVRRYHRGRRWVDEEDLMQEGLIGLLSAVRGFDPGRGLAFSAYALPAIRRRMYRYGASQAAERHESIQPARSRDDDGEGQHGRDVPDHRAERRAECRELAEVVGWVLSRMHQADRVLIRAYYIEGLTMNEIARRLGVTHQAVDDRIRRALLRARRRVDPAARQPEAVESVDRPKGKRPPDREPTGMNREKLAKILGDAGIDQDWLDTLMPLEPAAST